MAGKKEIRTKFRTEVFTRDQFKCCTCGYCPPACPHEYALLDKPKTLDAHHITDRNEMPNGGYVKENGISLCEECHKKAEKFHQTGGEEWVEGFHPNDLYEKINSSYELANEKSRQ